MLGSGVGEDLAGAASWRLGANSAVLLPRSTSIHVNSIHALGSSSPTRRQYRQYPVPIVGAAGDRDRGQAGGGVGTPSSAAQPALRIDTTPLDGASPEAQNFAHAAMSLRRRSSMSPRW